MTNGQIAGAIVGGLVVGGLIYLAVTSRVKDAVEQAPKPNDPKPPVSSNTSSGRGGNAETVKEKLMSLKAGDTIYSASASATVYEKPIDNKKHALPNPFKLGERIGIYGGQADGVGWSKVYLKGKTNPYLFIKTASITNKANN